MAISADRPEQLAASVQKHEIVYELFSDSRTEASKAMGIAWKVDAETIRVYKGYGIELNTPVGADGPQLPVPSVFIYREGRMTFQYVNPNHRIRLDAETLLAAARAAAK